MENKIDLTPYWRFKKIDVDIVRLVCAAMIETGKLGESICDDMKFSFSYEIPSLWVYNATKCKDLIESGQSFTISDKAQFNFLKKCWGKCNNVLTLRELCCLSDFLYDKLKIMLQNEVVTINDKTNILDFDLCFEIMQNMFVPFLEFKENGIYKDGLYWQISNGKIENLLKDTLKDFFLFEFPLYGFDIFAVSHLLFPENISIYDKIRYLIEDLPSDFPKLPKVYTYIAVDATGNYKIGRSTQVEEREKQLRTGNSSIEIIIVLDENVEHDLHKKYESKHVQGEWYSLAKNDLKHICREYRVLWKRKKVFGFGETH